MLRHDIERLPCTNLRLESGSLYQFEVQTHSYLVETIKAPQLERLARF